MALFDWRAQPKLIRYSVPTFIVVCIAVALGWYFSSDAFFFKRITTAAEKSNETKRAEILNTIAKAREWEARIPQETTTLAYMEAARHWKMIAEAYGIPLGYKRAIALYKDALDQFGEGNALIYDSAADVYAQIGELTIAEEYYLRTLALEPGIVMHHKKLANLYRFKMKRPSADVLAVYENALTRLVVGAEEILKDRAIYYEEVGDLKNAMLDWAKVAVLEPTNVAAAQEYVRLYDALIARGEKIEGATTTPFVTTPSAAK